MKKKPWKKINMCQMLKKEDQECENSRVQPAKWTNIKLYKIKLKMKV